MPTNLKTIRDFSLSGRTVFIRFDATSSKKVADAIPTIQYAADQGARVVLASHLGQPNGKHDPEYSLEPIGQELAGLLQKEVTLAHECVGPGIELMARMMKNGDILLLENLRFYPGEETNDSEFAGLLARLGNLYINDAFATTHQKFASTVGVPTLVQERGIGFQIEKELKYLDLLLQNPQKPFYALLGGTSASKKAKTLEWLVREVDGLVIGGALAHAFWAVQGDSVPAGARLPSTKDIDIARSILRDAKKREIEVILPADTKQGFDIGPISVKKFSEVLAKSKTLFWNGPLGQIEKPEYATGTADIAKAIAALSATKIAAGANTVSAVHAAEVADQFDHLSEGDDATLEYLEGNKLPGIEILRLSARELSQVRDPLSYE